MPLQDLFEISLLCNRSHTKCKNLQTQLDSYLFFTTVTFSESIMRVCLWQILLLTMLHRMPKYPNLKKSLHQQANALLTMHIVPLLTRMILQLAFLKYLKKYPSM